MSTTNATTTADTLGEPLQAEERSQLAWAISDTLVLTRRNLLHLTRQPQLLVFTFIQPVMFTLLFRYVFGGAIQTGNIDYVNYLMPGIFVQTVVFGATSTGVGLAEDLATGVVDRFRSLPMSRLAVLAGRTMADLARNAFVVALMTVVGLLVGFRPSGGLGGFALGVCMILLAAFALSWVFALVGLRAASAEAAQAVAFPLIFPLTFASSAFVPVQTMPGWLQAFARHQPITVIIDSVRGLMAGPTEAALLRDAGLLNASTGSSIVQALCWIALILGVAAPLAVTWYRRAT
ncbi:MAG: ABC transporter permease [Microthrixaceae bacterium]